MSDSPTTSAIAQTPSPPPSGTGHTKWTTTRRVIGGVVTVVLVVLWVISRYAAGLRTCQTTRAADVHGVQTICAPLPVQDFLPALLLIAIFVWPDITELDIKGVARITKKLEETNVRQQELADVQHKMLAQLTHVTTTTNQSVTVQVQDSVAASRQLDDLWEAVRALQGATSERQGHRPQPSSGADADRRDLEEIWRQLDPLAEFGRRYLSPRFARNADELLGHDPDASHVPAATRQTVADAVAVAGRTLDPAKLSDWYATRRPQLDAVRATLNDLDAVDRQTVENAYVMARRALDDLYARGIVSSPSPD